MAFKVGDKVVIRGWDASYGITDQVIWDGPATVVEAWSDGYSVKSQNGEALNGSVGYFKSEFVATDTVFQVGDEVVLNYKYPLQVHLNDEVGRGVVKGTDYAPSISVLWENGWTTTERSDNLLPAPPVVVNPLADVSTDDLLAELRRRANG